LGRNSQQRGRADEKVVEKLSDDDMIAIAAYTASLAP